MRLKSISWASALAFCFFANFEFVLSADQGRVIKLPPPTPAGVEDKNSVLQGKIDSAVKVTEYSSPLGFSYILDGSKNFGLKVTQVTPASSAFKAGVHPGDRVTNVSVTSDATIVRVERAGKLYSATIPGASTASSELRSDSRLSNLAGRSVIVLIDQSGSMKEADCPGHLTRWDWCRNECMKLTDALNKRFNQDITVVNFANWYVVHPHCNLLKVRDVFHTIDPRGDTEPQFAIRDAINNHLKEHKDQKAVLIAVVTDGVPTQPQEVADVINEATKHMSYANQIKITFLQVAEDPRATEILSAYDSDLVQEGARVDIVDYVEFKDVMKLGLLESLIGSANGQVGSSTKARAYTGNLRKYREGLTGIRGVTTYGVHDPVGTQTVPTNKYVHNYQPTKAIYLKKKLPPALSAGQDKLIFDGPKKK